MAFYIIVWVAFYIPGIYYLLSQKKANNRIAFLMLAFLAFFVACRVNIGSDWESYVNFFNNNEIADGREVFEIEPLFRFVRFCLFGLGFHYHVFFFFFSFLTMFALCRVAKSFKAENIFLFMVIYISLFLYSFQLNLIRTGIMCSCLWIALYYRQESIIKSIIWMTIGVGFHYLGLIFMPLLFVVDKHIEKRWFFLVIGMSMFAISINIGGRIVDSIPVLSTIGRVSGYLSSESFMEGHGLTIGLMFNFAFCIYTRIRFHKSYEKDKKIRILINMMLASIVLTCWINGLGIICQRAAQCMNVSLCIMWTLLLMQLKQTEKVIWTSFFTAYLVLFYMKTFDPDYISERLLLPYAIEPFRLFRNVL